MDALVQLAGRPRFALDAPSTPNHYPSPVSDQSPLAAPEHSRRKRKRAHQRPVSSQRGGSVADSAPSFSVVSGVSSPGSIPFASDVHSDSGSDVLPELKYGPRVDTPIVPSANPPSVFAQAAKDLAADPATVEDDRPVYTHAEFDSCALRSDGTDDDDGWCFLCEFRENEKAFTVGETYMTALRDLIEHEYRKVSSHAFTTAVQQYYNTRLRPYIEDKAYKRNWSRKTILAHIEDHAPTKYVDTQWTLGIIRSSMRVLSKRMKLQNVSDASDCKLDPANVKLFMSLQATSARLNGQVSAMVPNAN